MFGFGAAPGLPPPRPLCWEGEGGEEKKKKVTREKGREGGSSGAFISARRSLPESLPPRPRCAGEPLAAPSTPSGPRVTLPPCPISREGRASPGVARTPGRPPRGRRDRQPHQAVRATGLRLPGATLGDLDRALGPHGHCTPVFWGGIEQRGTAFSLERSLRRRSRGKVRFDPASSQHRVPVPPASAGKHPGHAELLVVGPRYLPRSCHGELVPSGKSYSNRQGAHRMQHMSARLPGSGLQQSSTSN